MVLSSVGSKEVLERWEFKVLHILLRHSTLQLSRFSYYLYVYLTDLFFIPLFPRHLHMGRPHNSMVTHRYVFLNCWKKTAFIIHTFFSRLSMKRRLVMTGKSSLLIMQSRMRKPSKVWQITINIKIKST